MRVLLVDGPVGDGSRRGRGGRRGAAAGHHGRGRGGVVLGVVLARRRPDVGAAGRLGEEVALLDGAEHDVARLGRRLVHGLAHRAALELAGRSVTTGAPHLEGY